MRRYELSLLGFLFLFAVVSGPLAADWLVDRTGSRIETRGPWEVKRTAVVFTLKNGTLSSLRLSEVDLDASFRASEEKSTVPQISANRRERRKPILVLTDRDIGRAVEAPKESEDDARQSPQPDESTPVEPGSVQVIAWESRESTEIDGIEVSGTLRNVSPTIVTDVGIAVTLVDHRGVVLARGDGFLEAVSLAARSTTTFRALFTGVDSFQGEPRFEVRGRDLIFGTENEADDDTRQLAETLEPSY